MFVWVDSVTPAPGQTVWEGHGFTDEGVEVWFAGDWRPMRDVHSFLVESPDLGAVETYVAGYQVTRLVRPGEPTCKVCGSTVLDPRHRLIPPAPGRFHGFEEA